MIIHLGHRSLHLGGLSPGSPPNRNIAPNRIQELMVTTYSCTAGEPHNAGANHADNDPGGPMPAARLRSISLTPFPFIRFFILFYF